MQTILPSEPKQLARPFFSRDLATLSIQSSCFSDAGELESLAIHHAQPNKGDQALSYLWM